MGNIIKGTSASQNSVASKPCGCPSAGEVVVKYISGVRDAGNKEEQETFIENFLKPHFDQQTDIEAVKKWSLQVAASQIKKVSIQEPAGKKTDAKTAKKPIGTNKKKPAASKKRKGGKAVAPKPVKAPAKSAGKTKPKKAAASKSIPK